MNSSRSNCFLEPIKHELRIKEIENVETRCNVVSREVNKAMKSVLIAVNMSDTYTLLKPCCVTIPVEEYIEHILEWKGLSLSYKARKIPASLKEYRKGAMNWANGRRALILATKVFPQFIAQSVQYCMEVALNLFSTDADRAHLFFQLSKAALISAILKSNVQLNQRAAETPLICQNSVTKYGFDAILKKHLPPNLRIADIAAALQNEETQRPQLNCHVINESEMNMGLMKSQKKIHQKSPANLFAAFQKAFTDLHSSYLAEYRDRYIPTENSRSMQSPSCSPSQSVLLDFNNLTEQVSHNLHLYSGEELNNLRKKIQQVQQIIQTEITQRSCQTNINTISNTAFAYGCTEMAFDHNQLLGEKINEIYANNGKNSGYVTICQPNFAKTLNTMETCANATDLTQMNGKPLNDLHYISSSPRTANVKEIVTTRPPQKRKMSFDHYDAMDNKRIRYNINEENEILDPLVDSILHENLEPTRSWGQLEQLAVNFDNDTLFW